jgi:hypothetical protein
VIDVPNRAVFTTVSTDAGPLRGRFNRKGDRLYIIFTGSPYLVSLDPFSLSVVRRIFIGAEMASIKVDAKTDFIYLGRQHDRTVDIYDPFSVIPGDFIKAGAGVEYMTIDGEGNNLCMLTPQKKALEIVNLVSKNLLSEIEVGEGPYWVALMGER